LTSPAYFIHGGKWHAVPHPEIDVDAVMKNCIEFDFGQDILEGILAYKIHRQHTESVESVQEESKSIWLLVAWHFERTKELHIHTLLVEHDRRLDEDKLSMLHQKYWRSFKTWANPIGSNWLLSDTTVLATKVTNVCYRWDVFISEGVNDNIKWPI
jgi:hypothetical protein